MTTNLTISREDDDDVTLPVVIDRCARCNKVREVSTESVGLVEFTEPLCLACRRFIEQDSQMDDWDREYERLRANGWED